MLDRLLDLSGFISTKSDRLGIAACMDQLRKTLAFLRCHARHDSHNHCPHEIKTTSQFDSLIEEMSKSQSMPSLRLTIYAEASWIKVLGKASVTPYFHILEVHVPSMVRNSPFGSIAHFQLQGQEHIHQVHTKTLFRASNWQGNKCFPSYNVRFPFSLSETTLKSGNGPVKNQGGEKESLFLLKHCSSRRINTGLFRDNKDTPSPKVVHLKTAE